MTIDVVAIGGCTVDIIFAADGETAGRQLGGNALYAAAGARLWGVRAGIVALRGTGLPEGSDDLLRALEIDAEGLVPVDVPAPVAEFFYRPDGSRMQRRWSPAGGGVAVPFLPRDTGEAIRRLPLLAEHIPPRYREAHGVHLAPIHYHAQRALAETLFGMRVLTLDPYPHEMAERSDDDLRAVLRVVTAFLPSREEVSARFPGLPPDDVAEALHLLGALITVIKQGREGCLVYHHPRGVRYAVPAVPVTAKDPTGAGDAFCGGFLAGFLEEQDILHAALCGAVAASFVVEDFGFGGVLSARPGERDRRYGWVRDRALSGVVRR